jgi:hypothetical protein
LIISPNLRSEHVHEIRIPDVIPKVPRPENISRELNWRDLFKHNDPMYAYHYAKRMPEAYAFLCKTVPNGVHKIQYETVVIDGVWESYGPTPSSLDDAYRAEGSFIAGIVTFFGYLILFCAVPIIAIFPPLWPFALVIYGGMGGLAIGGSKSSLDAPGIARNAIANAMKPQVLMWNEIVDTRAKGWSVYTHKRTLEQNRVWSVAEQKCMYLNMMLYERATYSLHKDDNRLGLFQNNSPFRIGLSFLHYNSTKQALKQYRTIANIRDWGDVIVFYKNVSRLLDQTWNDHQVECNKNIPDNGIQSRKHPPDTQFPSRRIH